MPMVLRAVRRIPYALDFAAQRVVYLSLVPEAGDSAGEPFLLRTASGDAKALLTALFPARPSWVLQM